MKDQYTITLSRHDLCNVLLALAATSCYSEGTDKWDDLHDEIFAQMHEQNAAA